MTDEMKLKMMETLAKSGMSVGQFVMENNGTMTYNDHRGAEERKKDDACTPAAKEAIMEYVGRLRPVVREQYRDRYDEIWEGILEISQVKAVIYNKGKQQDTTFNRNLLAKIIHQVDILYIPTANSYLLASHLENDENIKIPELTSVELDDNVLSQQDIMEYIANLFKVLEKPKQKRK